MVERSTSMDDGKHHVHGFLGFCELGFELSFAFIVFVLLVNLGLHLRIKYGDMVITHMTTLPYKIAYVVTIVGLIESLMMIIMLNIVFLGDFNQFTTYISDTPFFLLLFSTLEIVKFTAIGTFIDM